MNKAGQAINHPYGNDDGEIHAHWLGQFDYLKLPDKYTNQLQMTSSVVESYVHNIKGIDNKYQKELEKYIGTAEWINNQSVLAYDHEPKHTYHIADKHIADEYLGTDYCLTYEDIHMSPPAVVNYQTLPKSLSVTYEFVTTINSYYNNSSHTKNNYNTNSKYKTDHASAVPRHNPFGLNSRKWDLPRQASDYYLLHLLNIMSPKQEGVPETLHKLTDKLDDQFRRYTDMVIGGELRHFDVDRYTNDQLIDSITPMEIILQDDSLMSSATSRSTAWIGWYYVRQEYGTLALRWAEKMFRTGSWMTGYGGEMWADITKVLIQRELDQTTPNTFVDSCWGLHHNNGSYFNKWWSTSGDIQSVLDANLNGYYCDWGIEYPLNLCSSFTRYLVDKNPNLINEVCQCSWHDKEREKEREDIRKRTYFVQQIVNQIHTYTEGEKNNAR